ncbi:MAG: GerMN domain-containing protein [Bacilli bacterium]|nr:GerMN domain-containing protein [Bacilli bacterium]
MIKSSSLNRIVRMTLLLFVLFLFYFFPSKTKYNLNTISTSTSNYHDIFLLDRNNYVSKTTISVKSIEKEKLAEDLLNSLIINGKNKNKIPSGFKSTIPENTKVQKVKVENEYITISFSEDILKEEKYKEKMIESIVYTLTSIPNIKHVIILVNEKENNYFKNEYTRDIGVNKKVDITSLNDISSITLYYVSKENNVNYYIPVTKYINSKDDKIKIIIDELSSKSSYESNLMSYLNYETKLMSYTMDDKELKLYFNDAILNSNEDDKILEEVIYSISYSIKDSIEVSNIHFYVNDKEF